MLVLPLYTRVLHDSDSAGVCDSIDKFVSRMIPLIPDSLLSSVNLCMYQLLTQLHEPTAAMNTVVNSVCYLLQARDPVSVTRLVRLKYCTY